MAFIFECNFHWHSFSYLLSSSSFSQLVLPWESLSSMLQKAAMRSVSVLFRVHEGVNMLSDFLLKIGGRTWFSITMQEQGRLCSRTLLIPQDWEVVNEHYEDRENLKEFLNLSCQEKVGDSCSFCFEWTRSPIERYPKPVPDYSCLPEYHYLSYQKTPKQVRDPDDWQPRVQVTKEHRNGHGALLYLQIGLLSNQSLWCINFSILKCWNLKGKKSRKGKGK